MGIKDVPVRLLYPCFYVLNLFVEATIPRAKGSFERSSQKRSPARG